MNRHILLRLTGSTLLGVGLLSPFLFGLASAPAGEPPRVVTPQPIADQSGATPLYIPPRRGTPTSGRRMGGGTRGDGSSTPLIAAIAPDHAGLTGSEQPVLYWYLSAPTSLPIGIIVNDETGVQPILEVRIQASSHPGLNSVRLADYGVKLNAGVNYEWSIALILDQDHRSKDVVATGSIQRIAVGHIIDTKPGDIGRAALPSHYAGAGLWYDAIQAVSDLIDAEPSNVGFRRQRATLLEQVGLTEVAKADLPPPSASSLQ